MMKNTQNSINILTALQFKGIGRSWIVTNWRRDLSDEQIVTMINNSLKDKKISISDFDIERIGVLNRISLQEQCADGIVGFLDEDFPYCRGNVKKGDRPVVLFYKGDIKLLDTNHSNVAVIGVLKPEESVEQRERKMVSALLKYNYVIVSGLALGCDSIAHRQTLEEQGKTVAILPSPLSNIVPSQHKELAERIVLSGGLLITEYFEDSKSQMEMRGRYQERDRLQAMFSDAIILTASYDVNTEGNDSGSRLAMEYAKQYQIPRYIMYNEAIDGKNPQFDLNRRLLYEGNSKMLKHGMISTLLQQKNVLF